MINTMFINITTKQWIYIYVAITLICAIYLAGFKLYGITDKAPTANNATVKPEAFQNFSMMLATELNQKCKSAVTAEYIKPKRTRLFINPELEPSYLNTTINSNGIFKVIIDNFMLVIDNNITEFVNDVKLQLDTIIKSTARNNQFVQESNIDTILDNLPNNISNIIKTLETALYTELRADSGKITTNTSIFTADEKATVAHNFNIEVRERLFETFMPDKLNIFKQLCTVRSQLKAEQSSADSMGSKINPNADTVLQANKNLDTLRNTLADLTVVYKIYIIILSRLATSSKTQNILQEENETLTAINIQPENETQIDNMGLIKSRYSTINTNNSSLQTAELDLAKKYSGAYQDYLDSLDKNGSKHLLDPVNIISNLEESTISFLESLNKKLSAEATVNRFGTQTNNLGTLLANNNSNTQPQIKQGIPIPATDISKLANVMTPDKGDIREGFAGSNQTREGFTADEQTFNDSVDMFNKAEGFIKYIYDVLTGMLDKETLNKLEAIFMDDKNMIPIGFILIVISVILFLATPV